MTPFGELEAGDLRAALEAAAECDGTEEPLEAVAYPARVAYTVAGRVVSQRERAIAHVAAALAVVAARLEADPNRVLASGHHLLLLDWAERLR
jgi:hypothetical protein